MAYPEEYQESGGGFKLSHLNSRNRSWWVSFRFRELFIRELFRAFLGEENTMPFRRVGLEQGEFYHFYNRGNNKQRIFFERENYHYFLRTFGGYFPEGIAEVCAYCLMPNHYHLLVRLTSDCNYSRLMQYFGIAYVKAMNRRYERCGHLFQGRFKAKLVDSDEYLLHLSRYIHLNPQCSNLVRKAEDWEFSSYRLYLAEKEHESLTRTENLAVNTSYILSKFASVAEYRSYVESFAAEKMQKMSETLWEMADSRNLV